MKALRNISLLLIFVVILIFAIVPTDSDSELVNKNEIIPVKEIGVKYLSGDVVTTCYLYKHDSVDKYINQHLYSLDYIEGNLRFNYYYLDEGAAPHFPGDMTLQQAQEFAVQFNPYAFSVIYQDGIRESFKMDELR